jgi:hypothetical protein
VAFSNLKSLEYIVGQKSFGFCFTLFTSIEISRSFLLYHTLPAIMLVSQAKLGALGLALAAKCFAYSAPAPNLQARTLLGTNFGVPTTDRAFDYVVVGGGTAGLAVAARLSEDPTKMVAVVEAGSFYELGNGNLSQIPINDVFWDGKDANDVNPRVDWGFITTPQVVCAALAVAI